ncbi:hypothetical protein GUJ93_ZPchr0008g11634 [Zizania palustris]|uniref:Uncharacterized protein n=1 Tax=Zizania palustris TaxID=103762 RepID=A0A8J5RZJ4_ZIZPA|nr:hypothetical protein GUJ93_ZPchr0008g11634 [Zizania palustris]
MAAYGVGFKRLCVKQRWSGLNRAGVCEDGGRGRLWCVQLIDDREDRRHDPKHRKRRWQSVREEQETVLLAIWKGRGK